MGQLKKGNIYNIDKYYTYNISNNGNIESNDWGKLQYEIMDIKRTNVKNYYIVGLKASFNDNDKKPASQIYLSMYNKKNKIFNSIEPATKDEGWALVKLKILCNGKMRVQYLEASENSMMYIVDLKKVN
jgi:hypothetical protein